MPLAIEAVTLAATAFEICRTCCDGAVQCQRLLILSTDLLAVWRYSASEQLGCHGSQCFIRMLQQSDALIDAECRGMQLAGSHGFQCLSSR